MNARILRQATIGVATLGLLVPGGLLSAADQPASEAPAAAATSGGDAAAAMTADVALAAGNVLRGQVISSAGVPVSGVPVTVRSGEAIVARTTSGPNGEFEVAGLHGGIFQVTTDYSEANFRLWASETAPPGARSSVLVVHDTTVVRAQSSLSKLLSRPVAIGCIVATAVAVPVIIHQIQIHHKSSS
ncbi:MAG TPA: carboxypeptidase-like regulatory domain-containing protein [Pirellulales bacterium]|nr:carboxypeptidase-like regulatory domain-containing protein [Pirellulales bacterium]